MRNRTAFAAILVAIIVLGCTHVGDPTTDELAARDAWAKMVSDTDRAQVMREASTHTEWMERRKVQWEILQFKTKYNHSMSKKAATRAAASNPSTTQPMLPMQGL